MVLVQSHLQTGLKRGFGHRVLGETRPGREAARLLSIPGQEIEMHPVWEASCLCLLFPDSLKLPGHPVISYSILSTGSSCPLLHARVDSDNFVIVPLPQKGSALVISQCLGNSWPHKDISKGHQTQAGCLLQTHHSRILAIPHNLPYPQLHNEPPTPCCFWDGEIWKLIQEKQDQAKAKSHTTSFHKKKEKKKPSSLFSQQSHLSSAIPDTGKPSRR